MVDYTGVQKLLIKKIPTDMPTGQSDGGDSYAASSQVSQADDCLS